MDIQQLQIAALNLTEKESEVLIAEMLGYYAQAVKDIQSEIDKYYLKYLDGVKPEDYYKVMSTHSRLEKLLEFAQAQYNYYAKQINQSIINTSSLSLSNNWYRGQYTNAFMAGTLLTILDPRIIEVSVLGTKKSWQAINESLQGKYMSAGAMAPQYGSLTETILDPFRREILTDIQKTMTQGFIQGFSNAKMAKSIKGIMDNAAFQAERIARTESARTANEAIQLSSIDARNQGVNIMRMWVSSLDDRTRSNHAALDGQLAEVDKPFKNGPMRPGTWANVGDNINERCRTVNVIIGEDGTPDLPKFRRGYPPVTDPATGKSYSKAGQSEVYSMTYFDQWAKDNGLKTNKWGQMYA